MAGHTGPGEEAQEEGYSPGPEEVRYMAAEGREDSPVGAAGHMGHTGVLDADQLGFAHAALFMGRTVGIVRHGQEQTPN